MISQWCETHGVSISDPCVDFSTDVSTWENSSSSVTSLSSMNSLQFSGVDFSNLSPSSLENTRDMDVELSQDDYGTLSLSSLGNTCDMDVKLSSELDDSLPWEFQCKFIEDFMVVDSFHDYLIPKLVALFEDESLSRYRIAILTNLCGNEDNKSIIAETKGCVSFVARVLESESCEEQEQALEIFLSLCSQSIQYCRLVMDDGVIDNVVSITMNANDKGTTKV
ncbi:unnamed protein product [Lactuca virosa]|uniref:Uncharacterized protein n=1 Tax=Lactuca virosa TaxID=75947 RepID=A0AAU9NHB0_9ASTR|nr:unnamed protein product [Lactuca virosa]